jgi:hypothetical protein
VAITATVDPEDPKEVLVSAAGGFVAETDYTLTIAATLADTAGNTLPDPVIITFTTNAGT